MCFKKERANFLEKDKIGQINKSLLKRRAIAVAVTIIEYKVLFAGNHSSREKYAMLTFK